MNTEKISLAAVLANILLAGSKLAAGAISGSTAVFAEGFHSAVDVFSSLLGFWGIRAAKRPADKDHPYGHYKFEVFAGLGITAILFLTGLWILFESYKGFFHPELKDIQYLALTVMAFSAILNEVMARLKIRFGTKENSLSLVSDGIHSRVDVVSSAAVFAGLFLTPFLKYSEPVLTLLIGLYILKESFDLGKEAGQSLLDASAGEETEKKIAQLAAAEKIELSELKTQKKGSAITANIKIMLPENLHLREANSISAALQKSLTEAIPNLRYVAIQIGSHQVENSYYRPAALIPGIKRGRGFNWQRQDHPAAGSPDAPQAGPGGTCVCPACGFRVEHQRGQSCAQTKCPACGQSLIRSATV